MSLERYEIKEKIGEGGAGYVYLAEDTKLGRNVAIKRLLPTNDSGEWDDATVDSMLKEAKMLSSFVHPNIVTIYDADIDEDGPYVVMEMLEGRNIDELIDEEPMSAKDFERFATHSLEAIIAAHSRNIIHRDIKPNNIVLSWYSKTKFQAKLLDFGTAKLSAVPTKQTVDHGDSVMGSIFFMAPEQFERIELDGRTDIYALGSVFYYALTGEYPFTGETAAAVMTSHLEHRVKNLAEIRSDIPEWTANWVMWLINRNMDDRPKTAAEALEIFRANDAFTPLRTYDPSAHTRAKEVTQKAALTLPIKTGDDVPKAAALKTDTLDKTSTPQTSTELNHPVESSKKILIISIAVLIVAALITTAFLLSN